MTNKKAYVNVELLKPMQIILPNITCIQCDEVASYIQCAIPHQESRAVQVIARSTYCKEHIQMIASKRNIPIAANEEELKKLREKGDYGDIWKILLS